MKSLSIIVVGAFAGSQREEAIAEGFRRCGCKVYECGYGDLLYSAKVSHRVQRRFARGGLFKELTRRICQIVIEVKPVVVFFRRPFNFFFVSAMIFDRTIHPHSGKLGGGGVYVVMRRCEMVFL